MNKIFFVLAATFLSSCASVPPVQLVTTSKSPFDTAVFKGQKLVLDQPIKNSTESYRIFRQAATGFVPLSAVRTNAEQAATSFCERKEARMHALVESAAKPPYILGNFPRIELIFECVEKTQTEVKGLMNKKYEDLASLKKLLDEDVLTQQEFEKEKAKILAENDNK